MTGPKGPRWPSRPASKRCVFGVVLTRSGPHEWTFPGGQYVAAWDEHARAWELSRADGKPAFYGSLERTDAAKPAEPVIELSTLVRSLEAAVELLRKLEHLEPISPAVFRGLI